MLYMQTLVVLTLEALELSVYPESRVGTLYDWLRWFSEFGRSLLWYSGNRYVYIVAQRRPLSVPLRPWLRY